MLNKSFYKQFAFVLFFLLVSFPMERAAGQSEDYILKKIDLPTVANILQENGLSFQSKYDEKEVPRIIITNPELSSEQFEVYFFDCDSKGECQSITLWSWYQPDVPIRYLRTNVWNKKNRWVRAYLDQDFNPVLEMDLNAKGGIGHDNLSLMISAYIQIMDSYAAYINNK